MIHIYSIMFTTVFNRSLYQAALGEPQLIVNVDTKQHFSHWLCIRRLLQWRKPSVTHSTVSSK
jgi:hypothetical protein